MTKYEYLGNFFDGKNYVLTDININRRKVTLQTLDWFYKWGLTLLIIYNTKPMFFNREEHVIVDNLPFTGMGSDKVTKKKDSINWGITPMLSFGTPLVKHQNMYIGVGHLKIYSDRQKHPYLEGSNIKNFRDDLFSTLETQYGERYINHFGTSGNKKCQGFIYMIYFYILNYDGFLTINNKQVHNFTSMYISDAYLPLSNKPVIDMPYDRDYKFSLLFPMGLNIVDSTITVSCGYGDYYSCFLEYNVNDVIHQCQHNITTLDFNVYQYHLDILQPIM